MNETSLLKEYQNLSPLVTKIFVLPKIPSQNLNTNYLYQLYKDYIENYEKHNLKVESLEVYQIPRIFLSRLKFEKSILHYHWFEFQDLKSLAGIKWKLFWILLYKISGGKIIWTIHNKFPHHNKYILLNKIFRRTLAILANKLHVHCKTAIDIIIPVLKVNRDKFFVLKHPEFPSELMNKNDAIDYLNKKFCYGQLKSDDKLFLMFGAIAEYKGIKEVINIFNTLDGNKKLVIAGFVKRSNNKYFEEIRNMSDNKKVFVIGEMIPDEVVPYFLNSADCLIFNYKNILTSGGIYLALSYGKPAIFPREGCVTEMKNNLIHFFDTGNNRIQEISDLIKKYSS